VDSPADYSRRHSQRSAPGNFHILAKLDIVTRRSAQEFAIERGLVGERTTYVLSFTHCDEILESRMFSRCETCRQGARWMPTGVSVRA
jgi:hypothetical protein